VFPWKHPVTAASGPRGAASCSYPCFHGNKHCIVTTRCMKAATCSYPVFPWKQPFLSHNTFPWEPSLAATPCFHGNSHSQSQHFSAEPATRSYPVFPWKQPSTVTTRFRRNSHPQLPCFHGNNHSQSQHASVKPPLASAPFCMETLFDRHNPFPWNSCYCTIVALRNGQSIP